MLFLGPVISSLPISPVFGDDVLINCILVTSNRFQQEQSYYRVGDSNVTLPSEINQMMGSIGEWNSYSVLNLLSFIMEEQVLFYYLQGLFQI